MKKMHEQLLIVGIDPGTTLGYAAVDVNGRIVVLRSSRELDRDKAISELNSLGTVLVVATDKAKVPGLVSEVATRLGARVFSPDKDLLVKEKQELAGGYACQTSHEQDALAAALVAFRKYERLFSRIDNFLKEKQRADLGNAVKLLVVRRGIGIRSAFAFLTAPQTPVARIMQKVEKKQLSEPDYWKLYDSLVAAEWEKELLKKQNQKLENLAAKLRKKVGILTQAVKPETRIIRPTAELEQAKKTIKDLQVRLEQLLSRQQRLQNVLLNLDKFVVAKRMRNLGFGEFRRVGRILGFKQGDVLFVEEPNVFSQRTLDALKGIVELVVVVNDVKPRVGELMPFVFLPALHVQHVQDEYFAFLDKESFEKARTSRELLRKLVEEYQKSRNDPYRSS